MSRIPTVSQGFLKLESGKKIKLDSRQWWQWLESMSSFRYIPANETTPFTVRNEKGNKGQQSYWYAYRKDSGKLKKRYIGRAGDLSVAKLEQVGLELGKTAKKKPKVTDKKYVTNQEIEKLQIQVEELQRQVEIERQKVQQMKAKLESKAIDRDLGDIRDRILRKLKMGRQSSAGKALDAFIRELQS